MGNYWSRDTKNTLDLDEAFADSDEYADEFHRLRGDRMSVKKSDYDCLLAERTFGYKYLNEFNAHAFENDLVFCIDNSSRIAEELDSLDATCDEEVCDDCGCLKVVVSGNFKRAKCLSRRHEFVMAYLPNGAAVFL